MTLVAKNPSHPTHCQLPGSCHGGCLAALLDDAPLSSSTSSCIETCIIRPQVISFAKYIRFYPFNTFTHLLLKAQEYLILFFYPYAYTISLWVFSRGCVFFQPQVRFGSFVNTHLRSLGRSGKAMTAYLDETSLGRDGGAPTVEKHLRFLKVDYKAPPEVLGGYWAL